jgi:hypothetical protein
MSGDVERVAAELHHEGWPIEPGWKLAPEACETCARSLRHAQALLAPGGVVAGIVAEAWAGAADESSGDYRIVQVTQVQRALDAAREAGAAEVRARVESVLADEWSDEPPSALYPEGRRLYRWPADLRDQLCAALADADVPRGGPETGRGAVGSAEVGAGPFGPQNGAESDSEGQPIGWSRRYHGICPKCGEDKFIGHGPLCWDCYTEGGGSE